MQYGISAKNPTIGIVKTVHGPPYSERSRRVRGAFSCSVRPRHERARMLSEVEAWAKSSAERSRCMNEVEA